MQNIGNGLCRSFRILSIAGAERAAMPTAKLALILCIALDKKFEELFYF